MAHKRKSIYSNFPLDSSFIQSISWYEDANILMLYFNTGSVWFYYDVPFEIYSAFTTAPSLGRYFNANVRNEYSSQKLAYHEHFQVLKYV